MPESNQNPPVSKYLFIPKQSIEELLKLIPPGPTSDYFFIFPYSVFDDPPFIQIELRKGPEAPAIEQRPGQPHLKFFTFENYEIVTNQSYKSGDFYDLPFESPVSPNAIKFRLVLFSIEDIRSLIAPASPPSTEIVGINFYYCETTVSIANPKFTPFANIIAEQSLKKAIVKPGESPGDVGNPNTTIVLGYPCPPKWPQP